MPKKRKGEIPLVLASESPRRKHLLQSIGLKFQIIPSRLLEPPPGFMKPIRYARKLALSKARIVAKQRGEGWVLGADTVVVHQGKLLGKPADLADGYRMLSRLQGTTHKVITGVALVNAGTGKEKTGHAVSTVTMRSISPAEIFRYAKKNLDKAGCYAAQEKKDPVVKKVAGSYSNVVGLPLELVKKLLKSI